MPTVKYSEVRDKIDVGDIILFSGTGRVSRLIKLFTMSKWSHVGTAIWYTDDMLAIFESTTLSKVKDLESGRREQGVQTVNLSTRIQNYEGKIAWYPIIGERTPEMLEAAAGFREDMRGKPYEKSKVEFVLSSLDRPLGIGNLPENLETVFCSELSAAMLRTMGLLWEVGPNNKFTPEDLSPDRDGTMVLKPGYEWGDLHYLEI